MDVFSTLVAVTSLRNSKDTPFLTAVYHPEAAGTFGTHTVQVPLSSHALLIFGYDTWGWTGNNQNTGMTYSLLAPGMTYSFGSFAAEYGNASSSWGIYVVSNGIVSVSDQGNIATFTYDSAHLNNQHWAKNLSAWIYGID